MTTFEPSNGEQILDVTKIQTEIYGWDGAAWVPGILLGGWLTPGIFRAVGLVGSPRINGVTALISIINSTTSEIIAQATAVSQWTESYGSGTIIADFVADDIFTANTTFHAVAELTDGAYEAPTAASPTATYYATRPTTITVNLTSNLIVVGEAIEIYGMVTYGPDNIPLEGVPVGIYIDDVLVATVSTKHRSTWTNEAQWGMYWISNVSFPTAGTYTIEARYSGGVI